MANEIAVLKGKIEQSLECRGMIEDILGAPLDSDKVKKYLAGAYMEIRGKATLMACSAESIVKSLCECFQLGLAVDNRHLAYLVPFGGACTLMPGFQGYVYKIKEADPSAFIVVGIVRKGDKFECGMESGQAFYKHYPVNSFDDSTANIDGAYCYIKTANGSCLERMSKKELDKVRNASKMKTGAVWTQWELEMIKKSVIRRACKLQFTEAVAKLNAIDDRLFDLNNRQQIATIAPTAPMPQAIEAPICHAEVMPEEVEAELEASMPEDTKNSPISEPKAEQAIQDNDTPKADALTFRGEVEAYSPAKDRKPAGILIAGAWYNSRNPEVVELMAGLRGMMVAGTYTTDGKYNTIETLGDA